MYAVFGKTISKERASIKPFAKPVQERFESNKNAYQISPEYSSEDCAIQFVQLCKGKEHLIRPLFIARLEQVYDKDGNPKKDKRTQKEKLRFKKYKDVEI